MPSPSLTFAVVLATLYGTLWHLLRGGDSSMLVSDVFTSWLGFALGQALGLIMGITPLNIGPTNVLVGSLGSIIAVASKRWLARRRRAQSSFDR